MKNIFFLSKSPKKDQDSFFSEAKPHFVEYSCNEKPNTKNKISMNVAAIKMKIPLLSGSAPKDEVSFDALYPKYQ